MSDACIFCKIIRGELPSTKVYEDADTVAFMDINPVTKGHTLVVPKLHCDPITDVPPRALQATILTVQKIAAALLSGLNADGLNITQANGAVAGQIVPHVHFHVIPRHATATDERNWHPGQYDSTEEMAAFADKIRAALR